MNEEMAKDYDNAKNFWNTSSVLTEEDKAQIKEEVANQEQFILVDELKQFVPALKWFDAIETISGFENVLDYGCGQGWATICAGYFGCKNVLGVEMAEEAVHTAEFWASIYQAKDNVSFMHIDENWFSEQEKEQYDAIICSNVLDVLPADISLGIIKNLFQVAKKGATILIGMNFYAKPTDDPSQNRVVKEGNHVFYDGILRLVLRTDEEWTKIFEENGFTVEKLDHFAWAFAGETDETRRLFVLKK